MALTKQRRQFLKLGTLIYQSRAFAHHFNLSFVPAENVELFRTSPISSLQKLKLFIVHMYENFTTLT